MRWRSPLTRAIRQLAAMMNMLRAADWSRLAA